MIIQCSWCRVIIGEKPPYGVLEITHTICEECYEKMIEGKRMKKRIVKRMEE